MYEITCPHLNSCAPIKLKQTHEYKRDASELGSIKTNGDKENFVHQHYKEENMRGSKAS